MKNEIKFTTPNGHDDLILLPNHHLAIGEYSGNIHVALLKDWSKPWSEDNVETYNEPLFHISKANRNFWENLSDEELNTVTWVCRFNLEFVKNKKFVWKG